MKVLYLECNMGVAGDMLTGALAELVGVDSFIEQANCIGMEGVEILASKVERCGVQGTHIAVKVNGEEEESYDEHEHHAHEEEHEHHHHHHHHSTPADIHEILSNLKISEGVRARAEEVYHLIAQAEAKAHGVDVNEIHFHEVGNKDAVADIVNVCLLIEEIHPDKIICSPLALGYGKVRCAHGILPIPAPATANLIMGIPTYAGRIEGELTTPTGAALVRCFADEFEYMPVMKTEAVGYGAGKKEFAAANVVRAFLGEVEENGEVSELVCNLDDQTPEEIGFAMTKLMEEGALDVYCTPVHMKKNRPGLVFTCMCKTSDKEKMIKNIFRYTTTLGIREYTCQRHTLHKESGVMDTPFGKVRAKHSYGWDTRRFKIEYEDLARIAEEEGLSIAEVREKILEHR